MQAYLGNKWKAISSVIKDKNRSPTSIKVRWHFLQRKNQKKEDTESNRTIQQVSEKQHRNAYNFIPSNSLGIPQSRLPQGVIGVAFASLPGFSDNKVPQIYFFTFIMPYFSHIFWFQWIFITHQALKSMTPVI